MEKEFPVIQPEEYIPGSDNDMDFSVLEGSVVYGGEV